MAPKKQAHRNKRNKKNPKEAPKVTVTPIAATNDTPCGDANDNETAFVGSPCQDFCNDGPSDKRGHTDSNFEKNMKIMEEMGLWPVSSDAESESPVVTKKPFERPPIADTDSEPPSLVSTSS